MFFEKHKKSPDHHINEYKFEFCFDNNKAVKNHSLENITTTGNEFSLSAHSILYSV